ncbi:unnamed protein product, partial [Discosporangium mesarthrocarpum]
TRRQVPFATVVTDLGSAHPTWFDPRGDLVFVPSDVLKKKALERGVGQEKLRQFGLPVRPAFWCARDGRRRMKGKIDRTALIVGGGDGVGKIQDIATKVAERLSRDEREAQVVVVCGNNQRIRAALEGHHWPEGQGEGGKGGVDVHVKGFVANMDEWMSASDLLVTKVR